MVRSRFFGINRRRFLQYTFLSAGSGVISACLGSNETGTDPSATVEEAATQKELEKVTIGTSWYAQAEHGGFYQAKATGIYENYGLDVTIMPGGPDVNGVQLLMGGVIGLCDRI